MDTHEVLVAARNLIDRSWVGRFPYGEDEVCMVTALHRSGAPTRTPPYELVCGFAGAPSGELMHWNDTPGRTKEEVLAAFDAAIAATAPLPFDVLGEKAPLAEEPVVA